MPISTGVQLLKTNFTITETGGTGIVQLQSSADSGATWQDLSPPLTLSSGTLTVDDSANVDIDTFYFTPGQTYSFRLVDTAGIPVSNTVTKMIRVIENFITGTATIDFDSAGGDNWNVGFHISPSSFLSLSIHDINSISWALEFCQGGIAVVDLQGTATTDHTLPVQSHGAGVYLLSAEYKENGGTLFAVSRMIKVDATGTILADLQYHGIEISGTIGTTAVIDAVLSSYPDHPVAHIFALEDENMHGTLLASGPAYSGYIPTATVGIAAYFDLDHSIWSDVPAALLNTPMSLGTYGQIVFSGD